MKYIVILGDGMADLPIQSLGNKTPLQVANKPYIDGLATKGRSGLFHSVHPTMHPGSEVANMAVMGYEVEKIYEGRGVLEAASMGVTIEEGDLAFRCNLITIEDTKIKNHSAGHISSEEAKILIEDLDKELGSDTIRFYPGVSYRHLVVIKGGNKNIDCTPPHDVPGTVAETVLPKAKEAAAKATTELITKLTSDSQTFLENHRINKKRIEAGKEPANSIWLWSPGYKPAMQTLEEMYGIEKSAVISAVDLIHGIGVYAGMKVLHVEGATGLWNTNYEGKVEAALHGLENYDYVYLHIEAPDEAGHEGDIDLKIRTIEDLDEKVVKPIAAYAEKAEEDITIAILPDHPTPCELRTHTRDAVPYIIYNPTLTPDSVNCYDEKSAKEGIYAECEGTQFMKNLIGK